MILRRLLVLLIVLLATAASAADRPPQKLFLVGDHWTAWQPPTEFPDGAQLYLIEKGDTLWDLAGRFYGNPYLWPQIWEQNRYILDAHWIYPGDPLVVGIEVTPVEEIVEFAPGEEPAAGPGAADELFDRASGSPVPLGSADDIYCSGYVGSPDEPFALRIAGSEYGGLDVHEAGTRGRQVRQAAASSGYGQPLTAKLGLTAGDIVYLDGGRDAELLPGSLYHAVEPGDLVRHVVTGELIGRAYQYLGRVRVLSVQDHTSIGEIVHSCYPIPVGAALKAFEEVPIPLARRTGMRGINDPVATEALAGAPIIALSEGGRVSLGQGHLVFIDRGFEDDVTPGDIYTIYRLNPPGLPPMVVGELGVLTVEGRTALAKILESRYAIHVGDRLDPK